jgi:soluble P-type ATPase
VILGTAAVDIVRTADLATAEEKVLRKALENARMIASNATTAVKVFVV